MPDLTVLVAAGPCVMMAMAAVALLVVYRFLSPFPHALLWAAGLAASACQWALIAATPIGPHGEAQLSWLSNIFGLGGLFLFVEGFRLRATGRWFAAPARIAALSAIVAVAGLATLPAVPFAPLAPTLVTIVMLTAAAALILKGRRRGAVAEGAAAAMLLSLALIRAVQAALIVAAMAGSSGAEQGFLALRLVTAIPGAAAVGLFAMLLIASDFSVERWRLIHTDALTGILNRPGFEHAAQAMLGGARSRPISLAIADIDRFKAVNDVHGHPVGDAVLAAVAGRFASAARRDDVVGRLGGEEFGILLAGCDGPGALDRLEPVRAGLTAMPIDGCPGLHVSASLGIAERRSGDTLPLLIARADGALYASKRAGRDRATLDEGAA